MHLPTLHQSFHWDMTNKKGMPQDSFQSNSLCDANTLPPPNAPPRQIMPPSPGESFALLVSRALPSDRPPPPPPPAPWKPTLTRAFPPPLPEPPHAWLASATWGGRCGAFDSAAQAHMRPCTNGRWSVTLNATDADCFLSFAHSKGGRPLFHTFLNQFARRDRCGAL